MQELAELLKTPPDVDRLRDARFFVACMIASDLKVARAQKHKSEFHHTDSARATRETNDYIKIEHPPIDRIWFSPEAAADFARLWKRSYYGMVSTARGEDSDGQPLSQLPTRR
jgi:hypothetical protein